MEIEPCTCIVELSDICMDRMNGFLSSHLRPSGLNFVDFDLNLLFYLYVSFLVQEFLSKNNFFIRLLLSGDLASIANSRSI